MTSGSGVIGKLHVTAYFLKNCLNFKENDKIIRKLTLNTNGTNSFYIEKFSIKRNGWYDEFEKKIKLEKTKE